MAEADSRIALVIGNAKYTDVPELRNSVNDAKDMSAALKRMGWRVIEAYDADRRSMLKSLGNFRDALKGNPNSTALFYYAGHGVQLEGKNYLLPLGEVFEGPDDVKFSAMSLDDVLNAYSEGRALKCVTILDACRENPFDAAKTRAIGTTRGLSVVPAVEVEGGSATIFATAAGDVAQDGTGRNGIFTAALLKQIESGKSLGEIFTAVAKEVKSVTGGQQNPFITSSGIITDIYLSKAASAATAAASATTATAAVAGIQDQGKARFESSIDGSVYMDSELIGDVGPGLPLLADALPLGKHDFRFEPASGGQAEVKTVNVTARAAATVIFGQAVATTATTATTAATTAAATSTAPAATSAATASTSATTASATLPQAKPEKTPEKIPTQEVKLLIEERDALQTKIQLKNKRKVAPLIVNIACWTVAAGGVGLAAFSAIHGAQLVEEYNQLPLDRFEDMMRLNLEIEETNTLWKVGFLTGSAGILAGVGTVFFIPSTAKEEKAVKSLDAKIQALSQ
jgi:hypothetical protein